MQNGKLVNFLSLLSAKERAAFHRYLQGSPHLSSNTLQRLLIGLEKAYLARSPDLEINSKEALYQFVFGPKPMNETSLKSTMTKLLNVLLEFLAWQEFREESAAKNLYLLKKLNRLQEQKYFPGYHKKALAGLKSFKLPAADLFQETTRIEEEYLVFLDRQAGRNTQDHIFSTGNYMGYNFLIRMLRYHLRTLSRQSTYREAELSSFMHLAMEYIQAHLDDLPISIQVYFQLYVALSQPGNLAHFTQTRAHLSEAVGQFSKLEANELYVIVLNYATRQVNEGNLVFLNQIFELYQEMLHHKVIVFRGKISPWHFQNLVGAGLRLGKFEEVKQLIESWENQVYPDYAQNAANYCRGMLWHYRQDFVRAERFFNLVLNDHKDLSYGLNVRGYLLQIYYEIGNTLGLESLSHSFRMFLDRHKKISQTKKRQYIAFINHLKQLVSTPLHNTRKLAELASKIGQSNPKGMGSEWLLAKVAHLIEG